MLFCKKALKTKEKQAFSIRKYLEKFKKIGKLKKLKIDGSQIPSRLWGWGSRDFWIRRFLIFLIFLIFPNIFDPENIEIPLFFQAFLQK